MRNERDIDAALAAWGRAPMADDAAVQRIIADAEAIPNRPQARRWWGLAAGGALAASLALALLLARPTPLPDQAPDLAMAGAAPAADPKASFAMLYSMTMEEEYLL